MSENTTNINNRLTVGRATIEPATSTNGNVLFSLQPYIEKEHIPDHAFFVHQNQPTIETLDDINAPYAKVLKFTGYNNECTLGEKIAVSAGEKIYLEAWYMVPATDAGVAGNNYLGVRRYDKDKKVVSVNDGRNYVVSGLTLTVDGNWYKMSGYYTVESSHTPYNGSDGGAVRYLDLTFRLNFITGTQEIYISGLTIKKVNASYDEGDTAFKGDVGIGTSSPSARTHIVGGAAAGGGTALLVENGAGDDLLKVEDNSDATVFGEFKLAGYTSTFYDDTPSKFLGVDSSGNVVKQVRTWQSGVATTTTDANGEFILGSIPSSANAVTCCQYDSAGTATVYIFVYRGKNGSNQHFFKVYDTSGTAVASTSIGVSFTYTMYPV